MKYRIRKTVSRGGNEKYYPQYKKFLFWKYFTHRECAGPTCADYEVIDYFWNLNDAKKFISQKIEDNERIKSNKENSKIVLEEYIYDYDLRKCGI